MIVLVTRLVWLLVLHGPEGAEIRVAPDQIVTFRYHPKVDQHFPPNVKCVISTTDGKNIAVAETCESIAEQIEHLKELPP